MDPNKDRPAYVVFEYRTIEDRKASEEAGHYVGKDVAFAIVTPPGSKDRIERIATEWLSQLDEQLQMERIPAEWVRMYKAAHKAFIDGRELPENGTPVMTWPAVSGAQIKALLDANVRTVEDLAVANEATLIAIGMGGRALSQKAKAWLETAQDVGKTAARLEALEAAQEMLKTTLEEKDSQIAELKKALAAVEAKK